MLHFVFFLEIAGKPPKTNARTVACLFYYVTFENIFNRLKSNTAKKEEGDTFKSQNLFFFSKLTEFGRAMSEEHQKMCMCVNMQNKGRLHVHLNELAYL